jgi:hypothetical protein
MMILSGFGAVTGNYSEGKDFSCNKGSAQNSCYALDNFGSSASTQKFKDYQTLLNTFVGKAFAKKLVVDGLIGSSAMLATMAVLNYSNFKSTAIGAAALAALQSNPSYRTVAVWIPALTQVFTGNSEVISPPISPGVPASAPPVAVALPVASEPLSPAVIPGDTTGGLNPDGTPKYPDNFEMPTPWWVWLLVGAGAVGVVVTGVYFIRKRKLQAQAAGL